MKWICSIFLIVFSGCYYLGKNTYKNIAVVPSTEWSGPEQLTIIMEAGNDNLRDIRTNVKAIVTPYYPSVVKSIGRQAQRKYHWSEKEFRGYVDNLLRDGSAMFIDWDKPSEPVYDSRLQPLKSPLQFDSLMLLLTLRNNAWPCGKYIVVNVGGKYVNIPLDNPDCMPPDISHIEGNIFLVNEQRSYITPTTVWGRKMSFLTNIEETLFLKFKLREGDHHFLEGSHRYWVVIKGLEGDIKLELSTALMN
jgi:hypothetical protein